MGESGWWMVRIWELAIGARREQFGEVRWCGVGCAECGAKPCNGERMCMVAERSGVCS